MQLLSRGDAGPPVAEVRAALEEMGILEPTGPGPALFDEPLEQAVRIFQQHRGLITDGIVGDRKSTRLNSSHMSISYAVFCLKKKKKKKKKRHNKKKIRNTNVYTI